MSPKWLFVPGYCRGVLIIVLFFVAPSVVATQGNLPNSRTPLRNYPRRTLTRSLWKPGLSDRKMDLNRFQNLDWSRIFNISAPVADEFQRNTRSAKKFSRHKTNFQLYSVRARKFMQLFPNGTVALSADPNEPYSKYLHAVVIKVKPHSVVA